MRDSYVKYLLVLFFYIWILSCMNYDLIAQNNNAHKSLDIAFKGYGISFGNSESFTGLRFNCIDKEIKNINGFNFTFWNPAKNPNGIINGISVGLIGIQANKLHGITLGGFAVAGEERMAGINIGGLGVVGASRFPGINVGGLAVVGGKLKQIAYGYKLNMVDENSYLTGINLGGLAIVGKSCLCRGMNISLLGIVGEGKSGISGINVTGLAIVAKGESYISGFNFGGLAIVSEKKSRISGINLGGLALVSSNEIKGINLGGLVINSEIVKGISIAGLGIEARESCSGFTIACGRINSKNVNIFSLSAVHTCHTLEGFSVGIFNNFKFTQTGVSVGLFNFTKNLNGLQIGLINCAMNKSKWTRILPLFNFKFE